MLIEVMMSALLVALIVVATFNGFDVANRTAADQRRHNQAAVLAAQSQEQLRSDPANALDALQSSWHSYTQTVNGTVYTITEKAQYINDKSQTPTCTAASSSESNKLSGNYLQITSVVEWSSLKTRPKLEQSSIITPPTGSALEVDVVNGAQPAEGVSGIPATIEYTGVESTQTTKVEGTTGANGCVVFGAIPATLATLTVKPPSGYVTPSGAVTITPEQVTLAPNITVHKEFTLNRGGSIEGEFTWKGSAVKGETFVAFNPKLEGTEFILGDTAFSYESSSPEHYTPLATAHAVTAETPIHSPGYPAGDIFPWGAAHKYLVYAGDCARNNPKETPDPEAIAGSEVAVEPAAKTKVAIPVSRTTLNVYTGTKSSPGSLTTEALSTQITNTNCKEIAANNATKSLYVHEQKLSGGHLEYQYQPFGAFSLCVYSGSAKKNYTVTYTNETQEGPTRTIYLGEGTNTEQTVVSSPTTPC